MVQETLILQQTNEDARDTQDASKDSPIDFSVSLYEIGKEDLLVYVDRMEMNSQQEGWISFNVTLVLKHWLRNPEENYGLQLVCQLDSGLFLFK